MSGRADDGGSSGRLRRDLGVPPPGDIRRCLVALAGDDSIDGAVWSTAFEHRFADGVDQSVQERPLNGHRHGQSRRTGAGRLSCELDKPFEAQAGLPKI